MKRAHCLAFLGLSFVLSTNRALAGEVPALSPRPSDRQLVPSPTGVPQRQSDTWSDGRLVLGQTLAATALAFGGIALSGLSGSAGVALAAPLVTPGLVGLVVCSIGKASPTYNGACLFPVAGAYLGAASVVPLAFLGLMAAGPDGFFGGIALGWLVVQPLASITMWHMAKQPRPIQTASTLPMTPQPSRLRLAPETATRTRAQVIPGQITFPLLAKTF